MGQTLAQGRERSCRGGFTFTDTLKDASAYSQVSMACVCHCVNEKSAVHESCARFVLAVSQVSLLQHGGFLNFFYFGTVLNSFRVLCLVPSMERRVTCHVLVDKSLVCKMASSLPAPTLLFAFTVVCLWQSWCYVDRT